MVPPSTKAVPGSHDEPMTLEDMKKCIGEEHAREVIDISLRVYRPASEITAGAGMVIGDTKMEFGIRNGRLLLIDELLTPDSSRFRLKKDPDAGKRPESFDKQYLRDYLTAVRWNKEPPAPLFCPPMS
ncbi:MAG: hypothetical protein M0Q23_03740 [Syntrophales bacterium]|nr:hypothetical protein [Syntrophales bacterium]MCK9527759.1 hypothetical protein [Syntrophales bacterium]